MSTAYKNRRKARRRELRAIVEGGECYGTTLNQIRRGVAPRFTWFRGPKKMWLVDSKGEPIRKKPRDGGVNGKRPPYSRRWREFSVFRVPPSIKCSIGVLFGKT